MATVAGAALSAAGRRLLPVLEAGIARGLSNNVIEQSLRVAGESYRRTTFLSDMRVLRDVAIKAGAVRYTRKDRMIDPARLPEAKTRLRRGFSFKVAVRGIYADTGEDIELFVTVASNSSLLPSRAEEIAYNMVEEDAERYGILITGVTLTSGIRAGAAGTF